MMTNEERSKAMDNLIAQDADLIDVPAMTNEERAALVDRLRKYLPDDDDTDKASDQIEADGKRIAELEIEAQAQYDRGYYDARVADGKRIAELEAEVERLTYDGIHSCHDQCQRVACVLERRVDELENNLVNAAREILGLKDALAQVGDNDAD